jgi:broad-specificity NMP kinase
MVYFGQMVIGPPGAGKTTFCEGMRMFMSQLHRKCMIINLDFANDSWYLNKEYYQEDSKESSDNEVIIDVRELIALERVMEEFHLGPNGGKI